LTSQRYNLKVKEIYIMKKISTDNAPAAIGPYSQAIVAGDFLFASGQIPINPATGNVDATDITQQAEQSMKNVGAILNEAGVKYDDVVKTTCFLADIADFGAFNEVYAKYFTEKPARSCVAVKDLPKGVLCEVEVIAYLGR
jgi:2-iminobutanoate/2-iminopropanoate deaminase